MSYEESSLAERRCRECGGTGECPRCCGSGRNLGFNPKNYWCSYCGGTGRCPSCREDGETITPGL